MIPKAPIFMIKLQKPIPLATNEFVSITFIQQVNSVKPSWIFWTLLFAACGLICGCSEAVRPTAKAIDLKPRVDVAHPEIRTIHRTIAQPGRIDPYEQTAMYSKVAGFVQKWYV